MQKRIILLIIIFQILIYFSVNSQTQTQIQIQIQKTKIKIMTSGDITSKEREFGRIFIDNFPEYKDKISFDYINSGNNDENTVQNLKDITTSNGVVPEIIQINRNQLLVLIEFGILEDLTPYMNGIKDKLINAAIELITNKDKIYAFPYEFKSKIWFYRKDMFDVAGIDINKIITTDDFITDGKIMHFIYPDSYIWNLGNQIPFYILDEILSGNNAKFIDSAGNYIISKDPAIRAAFIDLKKIQDSGIVAPISEWSPDWQAGFLNGTLISSLNYDWFKHILPIYASNTKGKWACSIRPTIGGSVGGSDGGGTVYVIAKNSKNKALAIEILKKMLYTKKGAIALFNTGNIMPVITEALSDPVVKKPNLFFGPSLYETEIVSSDQIKILNYSFFYRKRFKNFK